MDEQAPTGGFISFGITQEGLKDKNKFGITQEGLNDKNNYYYDKVSVYCRENTHKGYLNSQSTNYHQLFKYVRGVDRVDKKVCLVQIKFAENVEKNYIIDISDAVYEAISFWSNNGFNSIFGKSLSPDICIQTGTAFRRTSNGLFIIKDDKPLEWLCDKGYGCTL